jgi:hypothetical protein
MFSCPNGFKHLNWTCELKNHTKEVGGLCNKCPGDKTPQTWELCREAQRRYSKEGGKASKNIRRTFCNFVTDLPMSSSLNSALSRGPKIKLGSLAAPSGRHMQSEEEPLEFLLVTHFPNSVVTKGRRTLSLPVAPKVWNGVWLRELLL